MSGVAPVYLWMIGTSLMSGAASYTKTRVQQKMLSRQQREEKKQAAISTRMSEGKSRSLVGNIGIDPSSLSVSSFLQAQKTSFEEGMTAFNKQTSLGRKRDFYGNLENIFGTIGRIGSIASYNKVQVTG